MQNFLAPISRLPNEMLLAIFEEAVVCQNPGTEQRAECTISKVSRRWRDLAIHSARLWRRVCVTPRVAPSMLEMYKTRGSRALDIEIWGWKDRRDFQRFDTALEMMLDSSSRWRSLSIASVCDTHLSHLTLKLSHIHHFSGLKHFTFRALRPGQTCSVSFLMETATTTQSLPQSQTLSPCTLESLDAENFMLTGDLGNIRACATQNFSRLSSLTLRRHSNDARSFRIMIDFSAFRAMLGAIPNLTTLVLHGQLLRFRTDPVGGPQGQQDTHGGGVWGGGGIGSTANAATITLPHLHTPRAPPGGVETALPPTHHLCHSCTRTSAFRTRLSRFKALGAEYRTAVVCGCIPLLFVVVVIAIIVSILLPCLLPIVLVGDSGTREQTTTSFPVR
ncbi:hypothetical protein J3R82DRAFT_11239 [Butyriboletus roseoflavus]|nr:hypothetical protein J3R82DRAFT_11239 [Butyriboletus roseoflavus]